MIYGCYSFVVSILFNIYALACSFDVCTYKPLRSSVVDQCLCLFDTKVEKLFIYTRWVLLLPHSPGVSNSIGLGTEGDNGFIAADIERSMLIVCGTAFSDINRTKETLVALSEPVIFARGGLPLPGRWGIFFLFFFSPPQDP